MVAQLSVTSPDEVIPFEQLKELVSDLKQDDWVLIRFLRARNYEVKKAEEMVRYALQWREEVDIKNYLNWEFPPYYKNEMAYQFFGKDNEGSPVLVDNGEGQNLLRWAFAMIEKGLKTVQENDSQGNVIVDLNGLSYSQVTHIASLKLFYQGCQKIEQCYPEIIKSVHIINAPWVFTIGYNFIKGIITRTTLEKIKIYGTNKDEWLTALLSKFPKDSIIPELNGDINGNIRDRTLRSYKSI